MLLFILVLFVFVVGAIVGFVAHSYLMRYKNNLIKKAKEETKKEVIEDLQLVGSTRSNNINMLKSEALSRQEEREIENNEVGSAVPIDEYSSSRLNLSVEEKQIEELEKEQEALKQGITNSSSTVDFSESTLDSSFSMKEVMLLYNILKLFNERASKREPINVGKHSSELNSAKEVLSKIEEIKPFSFLSEMANQQQVVREIFSEVQIK